VDVSDTSRCGLAGPRCESCGTASPDVEMCVIAFGSLGWGCLSLCSRCAAATEPPHVTVSTAIKIVEAHRVHLAR
jgi:hypothetical protein